MSRQNITITSKAGNQRIEAAIPVFMSRFGWARDQATAVAIRLESVGRLEGSGLIKRSERVWGAAGLAVAALSATPSRKRQTLSQEWRRATGRYRRYKTAHRIKALK